MLKNLKNSTYVTIINRTTNTRTLYYGIYKSYSKRLIQKYRNQNFQIFTSLSSNKVFIGTPCYK